MSIKEILNNNRIWVEQVNSEDPGFFKTLAKNQSPKCLWIGCSDNRIPEIQISHLQPGDLFVHRNIANTVLHTDLNCLAVIHHAVNVLKIKEILIVGHYGCVGVKTAVSEGDHGILDHWLSHIKALALKHEDTLSALSDEDRFNRLCEMNVKQQVDNICSLATIQNAWKIGQPLSVHGCIYDMETGKLNDLGVSQSNPSKKA